ncbi:hypothetical protein Dimus_012611 [Dionaea muscipula]
MQVDKCEPDDQGRYLLAIWSTGMTEATLEKATELLGNKNEEESSTVLGTLLIPCRTAMRGSFPLNGTYFQVNEGYHQRKSKAAFSKWPLEG